ncbi:hypothetical protein CLU79DRAFT_822944 [Phycomyces nitens]|nr:hypothetical protein CLU79DRAFT_822944 [Phycomyces nitens]
MIWSCFWAGGFGLLVFITTKFEDSETHIRDVVNLLWIYKSGLERSFLLIEKLAK